MAAARFLDTTSGPPVTAGEANDAPSACTQVHLSEAPRLLRDSSNTAHTCEQGYHQCGRPTHWDPINEPVVPPERNLHGYIRWQDCQVEQVWKKYFRNTSGQIPTWESTYVHRPSQLFLSVFVDDKKMAGKTEHVGPFLRKDIDLKDPTFLEPVGCTQREAESDLRVVQAEAHPLERMTTTEVTSRKHIKEQRTSPPNVERYCEPLAKQCANLVSHAVLPNVPDGQETNSCFSQQCRICNNFDGFRTRSILTLSHSDAKGNLQRPSGKRHFLAHSVGHLSFEVVDHVPPRTTESQFPTKFFIF